MEANTLLVFASSLWHAARPARHRRRFVATAFLDGRMLTREHVLARKSLLTDPYDLRDCDLSGLSAERRGLVDLYLDPDAWLRTRNR